MEFENLPPDCTQSLADIERILKASQTLDVLLSIAPDMVGRYKIPNPRDATGLLSLLWALGKGDYDYLHRRGKVKSVLLDPIVRNRINQVIDLELYKHDNNPELRDHWKRMQDLFGGN